MSRPIRSPNPDFPPNQNVVDTMNSPTVQKMVANTNCVDCSDIASYLYNSAGGKGKILEVSPATRNDLNVYENGQLATGQTYHQVYSDGQWPSPGMTDTFDRYDVPIGGITWHVNDGYFLKSLSAKQSNW